MGSPQSPIASSPPISPSKKLSFSVDSLLSGSRDSEEHRPSSQNSTSAQQTDMDTDQQSSHHSNCSSPHSDLSNNSTANINHTHVTTGATASLPALSMAAALQQRASFMRHSMAAPPPQLPHHALLYPWLMSAGLMSNPAASLLSPTSPQSPSKLFVLFLVIKEKWFFFYCNSATITLGDGLYLSTIFKLQQEKKHQRGFLLLQLACLVIKLLYNLHFSFVLYMYAKGIRHHWFLPFL